MKKQTLAAIDLGTNSCRLMICDKSGEVLYKNSISTRLGEGMSEHNCFTSEAINRGIECFCTFKMIMDEYGVEKYRAIATAACRMAENGDEFVKKIRQHAAIDIDVIDGYQEAVLNLKGALLNVKDEKAGHIVVYDLGGGSTEITLATKNINPQILHTVSIPWGARNAAEIFSLHEYDEKNSHNLANEIAKYSQAFVKDSKLQEYQDDVCFVATSSTPLRLAHFTNKWKNYDREKADGLKISTDDFSKVIDNIRNMSVNEMKSHHLIGPVRAPIFNSACTIFSQIYQDLGAKELVTSLKSAVDGIIMELQDDTNKFNQDRSR